MPRRKTSLKSTRKSRKKHLRNLKVKEQIKKSLKKFQALLSQKNLTEAKQLLVKIFSQLDKAAKKRIIHPNMSNRRKSRLTKRLSKTA